VTFRRPLLALAVALSLIVPFGQRPTSAAAAPWIDATASSAAEAELTGLIAAEHQRVCGTTLATQVQLASTARFRAQDMVIRNYFAHTAPDGLSNPTIQTRLGLKGLANGEILAVNGRSDADSPAYAYSQLIGSTDHAKIIRNCVYTQVGTGAFRAGSKHMYAVWFRKPFTATPSPTPTPTEQPSPSAIPSVAPSVTAQPTAAPTPTPVGAPAFLSRPLSAPIVRDGGTSVTISNVTIRGSSVTAPSGIGITIRNVTGNITIRDVDLANLVGGIYIVNSSGTLTIDDVRSRNIGDGTIGAGHSNHIQLAESSFSGGIRNSKFLGGRTEDMVSLWHSGGRGLGQELVIEHDAFQGLVSDTSTARAWTSGSGTGTIIGDGAGSSRNGYTIVRFNTYLTPGQVGIQHIDGPGIQTYSNTIFGERRTGSNNPMTSWEGNPRGTVHDNRYRWFRADGSEPAPWFSGYGSLTTSNNVRDTTLVPSSLAVNP
jgi:uncharacterized protein YkwD